MQNHSIAAKAAKRIGQWADGVAAQLCVVDVPPLSKILLLANDTQIADPTILAQIPPIRRAA